MKQKRLVLTSLFLSAVVSAIAIPAAAANTLDVYEGEINYSGAYATAVDGSLAGEVISGGVGYDAVSAAFDGDMTTQASFDSNFGTDVSNWMGIKTENPVIPLTFRLAASAYSQQSKIAGSYIQASNDGVNWTTLWKYNDWKDYAQPSEGGTWTPGTYKEISVSSQEAYQYFRYFNYNDDGANRLTEFQVVGVEPTNNTLDVYEGEIVYTGVNATSVGGTVAGEIIGGGAAAADLQLAFDGSLDTTAYLGTNVGTDVSYWMGMKTEEAIVPTAFRLALPGGQHSKIMGSYIQGSKDGENWTTLAAFTDWRDYATPDEGGYWFGEDSYKYCEVDTTEAYQYFRYFNYNDQGGNRLAEFQVFTADGAVSGAANNVVKFHGDIVYTGVKSTSVAGTLQGEPIGAGVSASDLALIADGSTATGALVGGNTEVIDIWFGIKFPHPVQASMLYIAVPDGQANYRVYGSYFQASTDGVNWVTLEVFDSWRDYSDYTAGPDSYKAVAVSDTNEYQYFRYFNYNDHGANRVGEFHVRGEMEHGVTEIRGAVAATTTSEGYTGDTHCAECGEKLASGTAIPKLSSRYYFSGSIVYTGIQATVTDGSIAGEVIGAGADAATLAAAFDGNIETMTGLNGNPNAIGGEGEGEEEVIYWMGIKTTEPVVPTAIRIALPSSQAGYRIFHSYIQASTDGVNWVDLDVLDDWRDYDGYTSGTYKVINVSADTAYQYFRYFNYEDRGGNRLGEFQVFGPDGIATNSIGKYFGDIVYTGVQSTSVGGSVAGEIIGAGAAAESLLAAFDGDLSTTAGLAANTNDLVDYWMGIKTAEAIVPTAFRISDSVHNSINGSYIQASKDGKTWTTLVDLTDWREYAIPDEGGNWFGEDSYKYCEVDTTEAYQFFRYFNYNDNGRNRLAEFQVFTADGAVSGAANNVVKFHGDIVYTGVKSTYGDLVGEVIGAGVSAADLALIADGNTATGALAGGNTEEINTWFGLAFPHAVAATEIKIAVPDGQANYRVYGSYFQASNDGVNWVTLEVFDSWRDYSDYTAGNGLYKTVAVSGEYTYFRYFNYNDHGSNRVGEFQVFGAMEHGATEIRNAVAATETTDGYTGDTYCAECGQLVAAGSVIPAFGFSGTCGEALTWNLKDGVLVISGEGPMADFTYSSTTAAPWKAYRADITKVVIGDGVTTIGDFAFYNCVNLAEVVFADGALTTIGNGAFGYTEALKNITIPASVTEIKANAFYFAGLETVNFAEGSALTTIGNYAFRGCADLQTVYIPDGVANIGGVILSGAKQAVLQVALGTYAYDYAIANGYLVAARGLISGTCGEALTWTLNEEGVLTIAGEGAMTDFTYNGATAAPWKANRAEITKIVIGADVTTIGDFAFYNCVNVAEVEFAADSSLVTIGKGAFGYIKSLKTINIPASVVEIKSHAFYVSTGLQTITFDTDSTPVILGDYAFQSCTSLQTVFVPESTTDIGTLILAGAKQATLQVKLGSAAHKYALANGYNTEIRDSIEGTCGDALVWVLDGNGVLTITGEGAMANFDYNGVNAAPWKAYRADITKVVIGDGVTTIGDFAFYACANLAEVEFEGTTLTTIGKAAFGYINALKSVIIPASVEKIDSYAFYFNAGLETVEFEEDSALTYIGSYVFQNCTALQTVEIPDSVNYIGASILIGAKQATLLVSEGTYGYEYATLKGYNIG